MKIFLATNHDLFENRTEVIKLIKSNYEISFKNRKIFKEELDALFFRMIAYIDDESAKIILAQDENSIVGLLWAYPHDYIGVRKMHINHLIISKKYRRQGLGKKLLSFIMEIAQKDKIEFLDLMASIDNRSAIEFYQNNGFRPERVYYSTKIGKIDSY